MSARWRALKTLASTRAGRSGTSAGTTTSSSISPETYTRLRRLGFRVAARSRSFYVDGTTGPLLAGEADRVRQWGEEFALALTTKQRRPLPS